MESKYFYIREHLFCHILTNPLVYIIDTLLLCACCLQLRIWIFQFIFVDINCVCAAHNIFYFASIPTWQSMSYAMQSNMKALYRSIKNSSFHSGSVGKNATFMTKLWGSLNQKYNTVKKRQADIDVCLQIHLHNIRKQTNYTSFHTCTLW